MRKYALKRKRVKRPLLKGTNPLNYKVSKLWRDYRQNIKEAVTSVNINGITNGTWTWIPFAPLAQGTDETQRIGDKITMLNIQMNAYLSNATANKQDVVRVVVIQFHQGLNGSTPTAADVFDAPTNMMSMFNSLYQGTRFTVLRDFKKSVVTGYAQPVLKLFQKIRGRYAKCTFNNTTSGSWDANHIFIGVSSTSTSNDPTGVFYTKLRYAD